MDNPILCERVRVRGRGTEIYFVVKINEELKTVDVAPVSGWGRGMDDVPFADLLRAPEDWSM